MGEIPVPNQGRIEWGLHRQPRIPLMLQTVYSCFHIMQDNFIAITNKSVVLFQPGQIREVLNLSLSSAVYIPDQEIIIGMSAGRSQFYVLNPKELQAILAESIATCQIGVFKMYYAPKSHVIISIGEDIRFWDFSVEVSTNKLVSATAKCNFTLRAKLNYNFKGNFLSPPSFSPTEELLVVQKDSGFISYNVDGEQARYFAKVVSPARICTDLYTKDMVFMTADCINGLNLWNRYSEPIGKVLIGDSSICYASFLDDEYILLITERLEIYVVDIILSVLYFCMTIEEKPSSILVHKNSLNFSIFLAIHNGIDSFTIDLPFRSWLKGVSETTMLKLIPKIGKAPRLLVQSKYAFISFISPKGPYKLTTASSPDSVSIRRYYYDIGVKGNPLDETDNIIIAEGNGALDMFSTNSVPCEMINSIKGEYVGATVFNMPEGSFILAASMFGDVLFIDKNNFRIMKRVLINVDRVEFAIGEFVYNTFIIFSKTQIIRFDVQNATVINTIDIRMPTVLDMVDDMMVFGYNDGTLKVFKILPREIQKFGDDESEFHHGPITGICMRDDIIATVSTDMNLKIWDYKLKCICSVLLPTPLAGVCIINGFRDVIVGTPNNLMILTGSYLFESAPVEEDVDYDTYCKLDDALYEKYIKSKPVVIEETQQTQQETKSPRRVRKLKINTLSSQHKSDVEDNTQKDDSKEEVEMTEEEKAMMLAEMSNLTNDFDNPKPVPQPHPPAESTEQKEEKEEEDKNEEEDKDQTQQKHRKKKIIKKKKHRQSLDAPEEPEVHEVKRLGIKSTNRRQASKNVEESGEVNLDGLSTRPEVRRPQKPNPRNAARRINNNVAEMSSDAANESNDEILQNNENQENSIFWEDGEKPPEKHNISPAESEDENESNNQSNDQKTKPKHKASPQRRTKKQKPSKTQNEESSSKKQKKAKGEHKKKRKVVVIKDGVEIEEEEYDEYYYDSYDEDEESKINLAKNEDGETGFYNEKGEFVKCDQDMIVKNENGDVGFYNPEGEFVAMKNPENSQVNGPDGKGESREGGIVTVNGVRGFYDKDGKFIAFTGRKTSGGDIGYIDENGNFVRVPPNVQLVSKDGEIGFYDVKGKFHKVSGGNLTVNEKGEVGYYNEKGEFIVSTPQQNNKRAGIINGEEKRGFIAKDGNFVEFLTPEGVDARVRSENSIIAKVDKETIKDGLVKGLNGQYGIIDENGKFVAAKDGKIVTGPNGERGIYTEDGRFIPLPNGVNLAKSEDGTTGFVDKNGNFVKVQNGKLSIGPGGKLGAYNENGKFIECPGATLITLDNGAKGYYDVDGNFIIIIHASINTPLVDNSLHRPKSTSTVHMSPNPIFGYTRTPRSYRFSSQRRAKSPPTRIYWTPDVIPPNIVLDRNAAVQRFLDGDLRFLQCIRNFQALDGRMDIDVFRYIELYRQTIVPQTGFFTFEGSMATPVRSPYDYNRISPTKYLYTSPRARTARNGHVNDYAPREPWSARTSSERYAKRRYYNESPTLSPRGAIVTPRVRKSSSGKFSLPFNGTAPVNQIFPCTNYSPLIVRKLIRSPR